MSPEEIIEAYNVVAGDLKNYTAQEAAKIGNSQASLGTMAERVARPSNMTSGLANYTYDRTMRPTVDSLTAGLVTSGKAQGLEALLKDRLREAKNNYENAKNNYTVAATTPKTNTTGSTHTEVTDDAYSVEKQPYAEEGSRVGVGSSGTGVYNVYINDGNGGTYQKQVAADSNDEARKKTTIVGVGSSGNGVYDLIFADGSRKSYFASSAEEAKKKYYKDNNSW